MKKSETILNGLSFYLTKCRFEIEMKFPESPEKLWTLRMDSYWKKYGLKKYDFFK